MKIDQEVIIQKIFEEQRKPGLYFYLLKQNGYKTIDFSLYQSNIEVIPIFSMICQPQCMHTKKTIQKMFKHSKDDKFRCLKCMKYIEIASLYYDSELHNIIEILKNKTKFFRISDNQWTQLPINSQSIWKKIDHSYDKQILTPSKYIYIKQIIDKNDKELQQCLKNYMEYDIKPLPKLISSFKDQDYLSQQPILLKNNMLYIGEYKRCQFILNKQRSMVEWISFAFNNNIFIGIDNFCVYISQFNYDQIKYQTQLNQSNVAYIQLHKLCQISIIFKFTNIQVYLNKQQLFIYDGFSQLYIENILIRSDPSISQFEKKSQTKVLSSKLINKIWQRPIYINLQQKNLALSQVKNGEFIQLSKIQLLCKLQTIDFIEVNKYIVTIISYYSNYMIEIDLDDYSINKAIEVDFNKDVMNNLHIPKIYKSFIQWLQFIEKQGQIIITTNKRSILTF